MTTLPSPAPRDPIRLVIRPIAPDLFASFGTLHAEPDPLPRQDRAAPVWNGRPAVPPNLALIRSEPYADVMPLRRLEQHPLSSQSFLPLSVAGYVVVVAQDRDGAPDPGTLTAFAVPGHVGLTYRAGAWHAHMMTRETPGTFAMLAYEDGSEADCVFAAIPETLLVEPA
ncbi:MAG: ureidoglycolate lyase [Methylobacterium sp.]|uniref:ureidoglycolate lyase n=1 Tax=Methylobacterium sp. TaxID=409 RepID=UPI0025D9028A|nr:ureidoglycolate lyase [Methylobacterium sp.]MBX9934124.1 ureidoglycolate lyase [Methylobacterium sp.]